MCGAWCLQMCFFITSFFLPLIISVQYHIHVSISDGVEVDMVSYHHDHTVSYRMHPLRRRHPDPSHESNRHKRHLHYHEGKRLLKRERGRRERGERETKEDAVHQIHMQMWLHVCVRVCVCVLLLLVSGCMLLCDVCVC